ncbi:hypothetical protein [Acidisoma sp. S159]|uniref:hypothetical protein n=1 Tax=Acidisoma sp. S159 TaxID=1747225 RepID=UPI00131CFF7C|nr:hypothetical protein [Acidisoma sp. S159]
MSDSLLTLGGLATRPLWVAWQQEDRPDGKPTKMPYAPDGRKARADDPATWGNRAAAEQRAAVLPKPYGMGGVGLELATLKDGRSLGGIDLDSCRDASTADVQSWASDVAGSFDSYAEVSPSGTGAKLFFTYDTDALPSLQAAMGGSKFGRQFKRGGGDHPPAIELHLGNRYFAVTDDLLPGSRANLRHIEADRILQLLQYDGPAFSQANREQQQGTGRRKRGPISGADQSRSTTAFRLGKRLVLDGATFEEMCEGLRKDPDTADWMREKGDAAGQREARRIFEKAKEAGPIIRVVAGELHNTATAGEAAIISSDLAIFQRGTTLVRPVVQEVPAARGRTTVSAALHTMDSIGMQDVLSGIASWVRFDGRSEDWVRIDPPRNVADIILSRSGLWTLPKIVGVITTPTIRPDGSILSAPGYDSSTRLYHAADPALTLSKAAFDPSRDIALKALGLLNQLLDEFPFVSDVSRSVALSGLITPVVRGALAVAPLHAFRANTAGTGKSYLVDTASSISSGRPCPVAAAGADETETEKRLAGLLLAGFPIASLDNVNGELGGDLLCQAIERPFIRLRPLGRSDIMEVESRATLFATGNALRVRGDMVRRTVVCDLDAGLERPELRPFQGDPVATVMANRGRYVSACLAIVRAYIIAGRPDSLPAIASFSDWSDTVRSALVWLGCADPADSMEQAREDDPELGELREVIVSWRESLRLNEGFTVKELADAAEERMKTQLGEPTDYAHPAWRDCIVRLAGERGTINTKRLGKWLMNREGRIVDRYRIKRAGQVMGGLWRWAVVPM